MIWSAQELAIALNTEVSSNIQGEEIQFNSNSVLNGDLFIAIPGNTDGHNYALDALQRGANAVIVSKKIDELPDDKVIMVSDTFAALHQMAEYKRKKSKAKFVGVTGSVGKTATKEALKIVLSYFAPTFASRGNFNNHLGVPINLASMPDNVEYAILEMGMNHAGEIRELTKMVRPDISIVTHIAEVHLEFFKSVSNIVDAKCEIFEGMTKDGIAVINSDHEYYQQILQTLEQLSISNVYSYGSSEKAGSRLVSYELIDGQVRLQYSIQGNIINIEMPFIPKHYAENYTAALQVAAILGLDIKIAAGQLGKISLTEGRGKLVDARYNGQNYRIICDYYNASPASVKAALLYLKQLSGDKKTVILGDMLELGDCSIELHKGLIPAIIESSAKKVFLVGSLTKHIYNTLPEKIEKRHFDKVDSLIEVLSELLKGDELILIKGSKSTYVSKIIQSFEIL